MEKYKVGEVQGYDVLYIPEKDLIFCKNTAVKLPIIEKAIKSNLDKTEVPEKNLTIIKNGNVISFGCLTTTISNCFDIRRGIRKLHRT